MDKAFDDLQVGFKSGDCAAIFRRGKTNVSDNKEGAARGVNKARAIQIVIVLPSANEKVSVFRNLKNLKVR